MARQLYTVEKGFRITAENDENVAIDFLFGSGVPGLAAQENDAQVGSSYFRTTDGSFWLKTTAGSGTDKWSQTTTTSVINFRSEKVVVLTNDADPGAGAYTGPFGDDDGGAPAVDNTGFSVGDHIIFDADGTPVLYEVTATSGSDITLAAAALPLGDGDAFVVRHYLPDSPSSQEVSALVFYNGTTVEKIGDLNWNFADGINLAAGYAASSGNVDSNDTVQSALQKLDGNIDAIDTRQGLAQGATNFGATSGGQNVLPQNATAKQLFEAIEGEIDTYQTAAGVTTTTVLDSVPIADYEAVEWLVHAELNSTPANRKLVRVLALHNGTAAAADTQDKVKVGSNFNTTIAVAVNGANMELQVAAGAATTFKSHRRHVISVIN